VDATATVAPGDGDGFLGHSRATQVGPRAAERWAPGDLIARGRWHRAGMRDRRFAFRARHLVLVLDPMFGRSRAVSRGHGRPPRFRREGEPLGPVLTDPRRQPRSSHAFTCTPLISFVIADDRYWTPRDRAPQAATCEGRTSADARFWESSSRVRDRAPPASPGKAAVAGRAVARLKAPGRLAGRWPPLSAPVLATERLWLAFPPDPESPQAGPSRPPVAARACRQDGV
jgi:hypothetical protein